MPHPTEKKFAQCLVKLALIAFDSRRDSVAMQSLVEGYMHGYREGEVILFGVDKATNSEVYPLPSKWLESGWSTQAFFSMVNAHNLTPGVNNAPTTLLERLVLCPTCQQWITSSRHQNCEYCGCFMRTSCYLENNGRCVVCDEHWRP